MSFPVQNQYFVNDTSRIEDRVYQIMRAKGRVSAMIDKGVIPVGAGYNFLTTLYMRSNSTGGNDWQPVTTENGTSNNCVSQPNEVDPAINLISWAAEMRQIRSNMICFTDLQAAYNGREQLSAQQENFASEIVDVWEDKDNLSFFNNAAYKIIANASLTQNFGGTEMPLTPPTTRAVESILDNQYEILSNDAAAEEPYARANGVPVIPAIMSMQQHRNIIKEDASTRQDFNYADMGKGEDATLLKSWAIDKAYAGFLHIINLRQPRYDWIGGAWVQRSYYSSSTATVGTAAVLSTAYQNAAYEDIYLWHKQVVRRNMPAPAQQYGAGTSFNPVKWNGALQWVNAIQTDPNSTEYNPFGNRGRWYAALMAGYQPIKQQYGRILRVQRCARFTANACY